MVNKAILVGNLGKDPVVRHTANGVPVATFSIATSESYKDDSGERIEKTEWHNIVLWRGLAEVAEKYLKKGMRVYVEGKITTREYEQDGIKKYITEIVGSTMQILTNRNESGGGGRESIPMPEEPPAYQSRPAAGKLESTAPSVVKESSGEDDLPF